MAWFTRAKENSAGERVTRDDKQQAMDTFAEISELNAARERLMREGVMGVATIVGITENVATTGLGAWHELALDVQLPEREVYRATRRVAIELSTAPSVRVGAELPVRVDPEDRSNVLVIANL
jgi:hypothetical protein